MLINSVHRRCGVHRHGGVVEVDLNVKMKVGRGGRGNGRGRGREYGSGGNEGEYKWGKMKENASGGI